VSCHDTYAQATRRAAEPGISRSEFFARAARRYLDELSSQSLTQQIDEALKAADDDSNGSRPAKRRPVLVIQSGPFNASRLNTTIAAVITSNTALAAMPGNVFVPVPSLARLR
jgi:hypothetical protein